MSPSLEVRTRDEQGVAIVRVEGEVDMANAEELAAGLAGALTNAYLGLIVDLSATRYLDSAGMHVLIHLNQRLRTRQQELRLVVPASAFIRRVLQVAHLDMLVGIDDSLEEALARVSRVEAPSPE